MRRIISAYILCTLCLLLLGCGKKDSSDTNNINSSQTTENVIIEDNKDFSVWLTYWDLKNFEQEISAAKDNIDNICYFAAYFNTDGKLFIPQEITNTYKQIKSKYGENKYHSYLSFVNDLLKPDGTSSLKDTELLYTLFSTPEQIENHINEIINMTVNGGYNGIEIDYEGIKSDIKLWNLYLNFINQLYAAALAKSIPVRIVLEPNVPEKELKFTQGPEYVIMCYNLYGAGTVPGPKANEKFLTQMAEKMKAFPGKVNFAFSSGGYDFAEDGTAKQVTEIEAETLRTEYNTAITRDKDSNCIVFKYKDLNGLSHEVWYADKETLNFWYSVINKYGDYGFTLWRIGGNVCTDLQ
ncbi:glycosyl hydrolase [Anaerocolumna sp. MB42-C2]|uniref:glycosyl hydrolase n=1 Tax=Anaerocolumna sp. MB42-C2 TaxID=3070997 RepID=UPI0027DEB7C4|nr:glycosyl hydrolase [Anaerocolumna sp. MB42-C2]WMJ89345.1 glycosyl hydrolase [Anaerocolumna sp. MB42-C2]